MIRKLLCWLGWHDWYNPCIECWDRKCYRCNLRYVKYTDRFCKHCGKVKK